MGRGARESNELTSFLRRLSLWVELWNDQVVLSGLTAPLFLRIVSLKLPLRVQVAEDAQPWDRGRSFQVQAHTSSWRSISELLVADWLEAVSDDQKTRSEVQYPIGKRGHT